MISTFLIVRRSLSMKSLRRNCCCMQVCCILYKARIRHKIFVFVNSYAYIYSILALVKDFENLQKNCLKRDIRPKGISCFDTLKPLCVIRDVKNNRVHLVIVLQSCVLFRRIENLNSTDLGSLF